MILNFSCKKVADPIADEIPVQLEIEDVWLEQMADVDSDGYYSDGRLTFHLVTNKLLGVKAFIWLGYKLSSDVDSVNYTKCYVTVDLTVKKNSDNLWYISINQISNKLQRDVYDFMLVAKLSSEPDDFKDKEYQDNDIRMVPLEPQAEDTISCNDPSL